MSPTLNRSSAIWHFKGSVAIEIRYGITFDFYTGLPYMFNCNLVVFTRARKAIEWSSITGVNTPVCYKEGTGVMCAFYNKQAWRYVCVLQKNEMV